MAIFNESTLDNRAYNKDEILDNMLEACDNMMKDMDELLDEHGGARNKYVKMKADEAKKGSYSNHSDAAELAAKYTGLPEYSTLKHSLRTIKGEAPVERSDKGAHYSDSKNRFSTAPNYKQMYASKIGKDRFMKDFGGPISYRGDLNRGKMEASSRYHRNKANKSIMNMNKEVLQDRYGKKKAVKEACLQILADLDEV